MILELLAYLRLAIDARNWWRWYRNPLRQMQRTAQRLMDVLWAVGMTAREASAAFERMAHALNDPALQGALREAEAHDD